jgi:hypothetical protein
MKKALAALIIILFSQLSSNAQKLLDPYSGGGYLTIVTASSGGVNSSVAVAYSVRQLKTTYDHPVAITAPTAVTGYTNSTMPLLRVRRSFDNAQLDIGYDVNGNLDSLAVKYFVSGKIGAAGPTNPTASGYVSVWYDQSGNSRDALQTATAQQPRIVNAGVLEVNGGGVPGIAAVSGGMLEHGGDAYDVEPSGVNIYGIDADRTLNVVSQPRAWTNGVASSGDGTYLIDRNGSTGIQDRPLTCLKAVNNNWSVQIRNLTGDITSSYEGSVAISLNRSDNVTLMRTGDVYPLYVNGVFAGSNTLVGENKMTPVRIGYGTNTSENVYYGEFLLFPSALSNTDLTTLNNSQNVYFVLGPGAGTWTGLLSNSWATAGNWSDNAVPTLVSEITIPAGAANAPVITTTQSVKKLTVSSGATLTITGGNLNVSDTVTINGTVTGTGTLTMNGSLKQVIKGTTAAIQNLVINNTSDTAIATTNINVSGTLTINANAKFSALPTVVVNNAASAGTITGSGIVIVTRTAATADYQSQYKFTTNTLSSLTICYGGAGDQSINLGVNYGNLSVGGSGTKTISAAITATNVTANISVLAGTLSTNNLNIASPTNRAISVSSGAILNAGTSVISFGSGTKTMTINGTFQTANTNGFSGTTSTAVSSTNTPTFSIGTASTIEYTAAGTQTMSVRTDYGNVTLNGGSKTIEAGTHTLAGALTISSGATYNGATNNPILNVGGDFTNSGTFTSGTGTVTFNGTSTQSISSGVTPLTFAGSAAFSGSSTTTMNVNISVAGNLNINSGKTLDLGTFTANRATSGGTLTVAGTLKLGANTGGQTGSNFPLNYTTLTLTGGTIEYNGSNAITQTVFATTYAGLTLTNGSGSGTALKISTASFAVNTGSFTINTGARFTPAAANIISGTGTLTGTGTIDVTGSNLASQYTISNQTLTNLTINYGGGSQTIPGGTYSLLSISGTGTKTMGGAITVTGDVTIESGNTLDVSLGNNYALSIAGDFTNNGTFTQRSSTVTLNGSGSQIIGGSTATSFNNLTINKTSDTVFVNTNINVSTTLTLGSSVNAVLYPSATTVINTATAAGTITGTGSIYVTRIATTADLKNQFKFSTYTFTNITAHYVGLGDQTINFTGINYSNLVVNGSGTKTIDAAITSTNVTANITVNAATLATNNLAIASPANRTITIAAGATMDAGTSVIAFGATTKTIIINGTFKTANLNGFSGSTTRAISSTNTPTITIGSASTIEYNASATQIVTNRTDYANLVYTGGSKTMSNNTFTLSGSLTINSGATYNGTTTTPTLSVAGDFTNNGTFIQGTNTVTFNGTAEQIIGGSTTPTAFSASVIFSGTSSTATLATNITVGGNLNVNTGKTLDMGTYTCNRATSGGTLTVAGTLKLAAATGGRTGSNFPNNFTTNTLTNGTIEYNGSDAITQTVYGGITYYNLTLTNGTGTGTAVKNSTASFVVNTGSFTIGLNVRFVPAAANVISGSGTMTGYGAIEVTGTSLAVQYTITGQSLTNITIDYTGTTQTIAAGTYTSLSVTGGGTKTLGGTVSVTGDVDIESGSTLSVGTNNALNVGGNWTNNGTYTQGTGTVTLNGLSAQTIGGTVSTTFNNLTITNTSATVSVNTNTNVSGTLNMNGTSTNLSPAAAVVFNSAAAAGTLSGTGKVQVTRVATTADFRNQYKFSTYTLTTLTVEYSGAGTQTINLTGTPTINYSNIIISGTGTKTLDAAMSATNATGNITVNSGTFATGNFNIVSPASRTITVALGATLSAGTSVISFGATTKVLNLYGTFTTSNTNGFSGTTTTSISSTNTPTITLSSTSTVEYNAAGTQTITFATGINYGNLKINGSGTKSLAAPVSITNVTGDIWVSAGTLSNNTGFAIVGNNDNTLTIDAGTTLLLNGTSTFPTGFGAFVVDNASTVNFGGAAQNIEARQYGHLITSGSAGKTLLGNITVNGDITVGGTGLTASSFTITVLGNWANNATFTANTSTVLLNGTSAQVMSGSTVPSFNNLTLDNAAGASMSASVTVGGALTLTSGKLALGSNTLTINGALSSSATNLFTANGSSNITFGGSGNATFYLDQTTDGTTNRLGTLTVNRSGSTITMANNVQTATGLALTGKLAIGSNTLTLDGTVSTSGTNAIVSTGASNITFGGTGAVTFHLDQTTDGTTNRLGTLLVNRSAATVTMGNSVQTATALTLTSGKLATGANTLTINGTLSTSATNSLVGNGLATSTIAFGNTGNATFFMDQTTNGTTNQVGTLTVNRTGNVITMGNSLQVFSALTLTAGQLAIGANPNILTVNGSLTTTTTNSLIADGTSNITFATAASGATFHLDQTTDGTTNKIGTLIINRSAQTITMGSNVQVATTLTFTTGKLAIGSNTLTLNGTLSTTGSNCLVANGSSNLTFGGTGNVTFNLDQTTLGTTNRLGTMIIDRSGATITMNTTMSMQVATALTLTSGKLAIGSNTLAIDGILTSSTSNYLIGNGNTSCVLTFGGSATSSTLCMDQTTDGTTNGVGTLTINRTGQTVTLGSNLQTLTALTLTNGKLAIGSNTLTVNGTLTNTATNCFVANGSSSITFVTGTNSPSIFLDQTTDGTTNRLGTLIFNRTGQTLTMGTSLQTATALTLTNGKLIIGSNTLTVDGAITHTSTNSLVANGSSNITFGGSGAITLCLDQTTNGITNRLGTLIINRSNAIITMNTTMSMQIATALTLTSGKLAIGSNTLTIDGILTSSTLNYLIGNGNTNCVLTFGGSATSSTLCMDQTTDGTTNEVGTLTINRTGQTVTLGSNLQALTALTLTNGKLAVGSNTLTVIGTLTNTATNCLVGNGSSSITFVTGTNSPSIFLDQTTDGTTNRLGTLIFNRTGQTLTMGNSLQTATALTLTNGKLIAGSNTLTINGTFTGSGTNSITANGSSNITLGGSGNTSFFLDQTADGTTNRLGTMIVNRTGNTITMGGNVQTATALTLTAGKLAIGSNTLTINGTVSTTSTNTLEANGSSNVTFGGTGNATIHFDQTTDGTTNRLATLLFNRTGNTLTMGSNMQTATALTLTAGKLALGSNTLTMNGTLTSTATNNLVANGSSGITIGGTGALGSNLFLDQTIIGTTNRLANLTYNRASQTITLGDTVEVTGIVTPSNGTLATGNKLKLISNASGDAMIAAGTGSYITGVVTVERYLPAKANKRWRFMSSPVSGATLADWKNEMYVTGTSGVTNGFDASASNQSSIYDYNEAAITGDFNTGWTAATNITNILTPGKGFRVFVRGDRTPGRLDGSITNQNAITLNTVNDVNKGNINMSPTFTSSGILADDGWNLMGNPYPAPIDWNAFHDAGRSGSSPDYSGTDYTHLDAVVYIYDPSSNGFTSYNAFSGATIGSMTNGVIPSGGAFYVKASASSPTMTMKEIYKTTTAATGAIFKTGPGAEQFTIKLLSDAETHDEAVIKYVNEATTGFDGYDIKKMYGGDVNIATIASDASFLSANYKPFNGESDSIMLSMGIAKTGSYAFEFNDPDLLITELPVYLIDLYKHQSVNLRNQQSYPFTVDVNDKASLGNARFAIVIGTEQPNTGVEQVTPGVANLMVYPTITSGMVTLFSSAPGAGKVSIDITDISGKHIAGENNLQWNSGRIELDLSAYAAGTYFITLEEAGKGASTLRCVKQ